jgi:hypothetical protein
MPAFVAFANDRLSPLKVRFGVYFAVRRSLSVVHPENTALVELSPKRMEKDANLSSVAPIPDCGRGGVGEQSPFVHPQKMRP